MSSSDNRAPPLIAVTAIFISISAISAGLRLFTRLRLLRWIGIDDILIFCATFAAIVQGAGIFIGNTLSNMSSICWPHIATNYGLARHIADQPPEWRRPFAIADLTASLAYSTAAMFVKLSLLSFYLRLRYEIVLIESKPANWRYSTVESEYLPSLPTFWSSSLLVLVSLVFYQRLCSAFLFQCFGMLLNQAIVSMWTAFTLQMRVYISLPRFSYTYFQSGHFGISICQPDRNWDFVVC